MFRSLVSGLAILSVVGCQAPESDIAEALRQGPEAKQKFIAAGLPLTVEDFNATIHIPASQNAFDPMENFYKKWSKVRDEHSKKEAKNPSKLDPNNPWFPDLLSDVEAFIDRPYYWAPVTEPSKDPIGFIPQGSFKKQLVKLALKTVDTDLNRNDFKSAAHHFWIAARVSNWADDRGDIIGVLIRSATDALILEKLRTTLEAHFQQKQFVDGLKPVMDELSIPLNTSRMLAIESLTSLSYIQAGKSRTPQQLEEMLSADEDTKATKEKIKLLIKSPRAMEAVVARLYQFYTIGQEKLPKDPEDFKQWDKAMAEMSAFGPRPGPSYILANRVADLYEKLNLAPKNRRSKLNVALQSWEAAKYWHAHGSFPTALSLDSRAQTDFQTYTPLRTDFSRGFKVWTVGPNHLDENGTRNTKANKDDYGINLVARAKNPTR